jgi:hypothetical protein
MEMGDSFYIGNLNSPLVKGVQFVNETGLVYYLSGTPTHQVNGIYNGGEILLSALRAGEAGNSIQIQEYQCSFGGGLYAYTPYLTGGMAVGTTGDAVVALGAFTGSTSTLLTGSGSYQQIMSGNATGLFLYTRTFTGAWDVQTGLNPFTLVSMKAAGTFSANAFSGSLSLPPNSQMTLRIISSGDNINTDAARLIVSGSEILNPITQTLISPNG